MLCGLLWSAILGCNFSALREIVGNFSQQGPRGPPGGLPDPTPSRGIPGNPRGIPGGSRGVPRGIPGTPRACPGRCFRISPDSGRSFHIYIYISKLPINRPTAARLVIQYLVFSQRATCNDSVCRISTTQRCKHSAMCDRDKISA